ncbi:type I 3-dehydroquinate dehydratase [Lacticaseibacillus sp. GG6-2]
MNAFIQALQQPQPAIAVPLTAADGATLLQEVDAVCQSPAQVAEWRLDAWPEVPDKIAQLLAKRLREADKLLLLTLRTRAEGGAFAGTVADYVALYRRLLPLVMPDAIDIEASVPVVSRKALVKLAHDQQCVVVGSHHDFKQTPPFETAQALLQSQSLWADVVKLAAMPQIPADTLNLLATSAWARTHLSQPAIVIGMGALGQLTRIASGAFASALTFATLDRNSAPGQLRVQVIQMLQEAMQ